MIDNRNSRISKDDACAACVLDGELGLAVLACDAPDCAREVVPVESFDVFDFEGVEVEVVHTEEGDGVL